MDEPKTEFKVPDILLSRKKNVKPVGLSVHQPDSKSSTDASSSDATCTPDLAEDANSQVIGDHPKVDKLGVKKEGNTTSDRLSFPPLPYTVPHWSTLPSEPYFLSVIKNGTVISEFSLTEKPYIVFGRLPCCDVQLEHPSLSRYHAVLQYRPHLEPTDSEQSHSSTLSANPRESGYYMYDLGSTHGTFVNKYQISPRCYYRLRVGQMVKFGGSSRMFLLESGVGGQADVEASAEEEIKEILERKEEMERKKAEAEATRERLAKERENMGVMWGIVMDDGPQGMEEEYELDPEKEAYYIDDPKKALRKFFDREGLELEYETGEEGPSRSKVYTARVRLPIDTASGESLYAEASVQGKKKEAVLQCALNACRILDAHDMLRENTQKRKKRKRNWEENDYYDSDEDTFLDRTGAIEVKRKQRMKKAGVAENTVETYQSLQEQLKSIQREIAQIEQKLKKSQQVSDRVSGEGDLDDFMKIVGHQLDPSKKKELKQKLHSLRKEEERVNSLILIARPAEMPAKTSSDTTHSKTEAEPTQSAKPRRTEKTQTKKVTRTDKKPKPQGQTTISSPKESQESVKTDTGKNLPRPLVTKSSKEGKSGLAMHRPSFSEESANNQHSSKDSSKEEQWQADEDYTDWLPPEHQSGDGRTHLNEKYGY